MKNIFNPDNRFFTFMGKVADIMLVNLLCMICCIPIITAGASITAMYYMTLKIARGEESYVTRGFFHSFRQNLKQATIIHVIMIVLAIVFGFDLYFSKMIQSGQPAFKFLTYLFLCFFLIYFMVFIYVYPILAKFDNTVKNTFKNALFMSIRHFPSTVLMLLIGILPWILFFYFPNTLPMILMFYALMGFGMLAYINSLFLVRIFAKYIPEEENEEELPED